MKYDYFKVRPFALAIASDGTTKTQAAKDLGTTRITLDLWLTKYKRDNDLIAEVTGTPTPLKLSERSTLYDGLQEGTVDALAMRRIHELHEENEILKRTIQKGRGSEVAEMLSYAILDKTDCMGDMISDDDYAYAVKECELYIGDVFRPTEVKSDRVEQLREWVLDDDRVYKAILEATITEVGSISKLAKELGVTSAKLRSPDAITEHKLYVFVEELGK